jgi:hypothetical protein
MALLVNRLRSTATIWSKSSGFLQRLGRRRHATTAANVRLLDWLAKAGYWMMTPHKIPARIALIRQLTSKNEQLLALNAELAGKIEQLERLHVERATQLGDLSKQSALDRPFAFMHVPKTSGAALRAGLREVLPSTACIEGFDRGFFGAFRSGPCLRNGVKRSMRLSLPEMASTLLLATWRIPPLSKVGLPLAS